MTERLRLAGWSVQQAFAVGVVLPEGILKRLFCQHSPLIVARCLVNLCVGGGYPCARQRVVQRQIRRSGRKGRIPEPVQVRVATHLHVVRVFGQEIGSVQGMVEPVGLRVDVGVEVSERPHLFGLPGHRFECVNRFSVGR